METIRQARQRLTLAGINYQSDGGGGFELWRGSARVGRVYSEAALITWREESTAVVGVVMMNAKEALDTIDRIKSGVEGLRRDLLDLEDREGWKALGYSSWGACAKAEFGPSAATLYRQLEAAQIERDVRGDSQVENQPPIPTAQLQVVKPLPSAQRKEAFDRADQLAGDEPRTATHVRQAVAEIKTPAELPDVVRFGFTARALPDGWIGLRAPGDLESQHTAAHLAQLIAAWEAYPPIPADLAAAGVTWRYRTERGYYQVMIGDGIGPTGYAPDTLFSDTRDRMRRLGGLPAEVEIVPTPPGSWICERCEQIQTGMRKPNPPVCTSCAMASLNHHLAPATDHAAPSAVYNAQVKADQMRLIEAESAITRGDLEIARTFLLQVEVKTVARDELWIKLTGKVPAPSDWWNAMRACERAAQQRDWAGALEAARKLVTLFEQA